MDKCGLSTRWDWAWSAAEHLPKAGCVVHYRRGEHQHLVQRQSCSPGFADATALVLLWWGTTITALQAERCRCFPGRSSYLQNLDRFLQQTPSLPQHDSITHAEFILPCKIFTLFPRKSLLFHSNSTLCTEKEAGGEQWGSGPYAPAFIALSSPPCSIQGIYFAALPTAL